MDAQSLIDDRVKVGEPLHLVGVGDQFILGAKLLVKLFVEFVLHVRVGGKMIDDSAGRAKCAEHCSTNRGNKGPTGVDGVSSAEDNHNTGRRAMKQRISNRIS